MKKSLLITDVVKEVGLEKKILSKFNIIFKKINDLTKKDFLKIDGILTGHEIVFDKKMLRKFPNCKVIVRYGAGYNNIDINKARDMKIRVFNVPDYGTNEVADVAIAMTMSLLKNLNEFYFNILKKDKLKYWNYESGYIHRRLSKLKIGVVGLGRIGKSFASRFNSLGSSIYFYDPYVKNKKFKKISSLGKLFSICDVISLHVPSTKETKFFITDKLIKKTMKKIILINTARGDLIKQKTVIKGLKSGKILCYGADVLEKEPINFKDKFFKLIKKKEFQSRVIITPHSAFYTKESFFDLRFKACKIMNSFLLKNSLKNCVNK